MYYFHLSEANLIKAYEAGVARRRFATQRNARTYGTNTCIHTQTGRRHTHTHTHGDAGRVIQLKKVKADVFPKNDGL